MSRDKLAIQDLLRNLHLIEIRARKKMQGGLASSYRNVFRGQGLEFAEVREYVEGDDIRLIDWNVSARFSNLFIKQLNEERELNIVSALQCSRSMDYGTVRCTKFQSAAEVAAMVIFSAIHTGDRPGLILFGGGAPLEYIPPQRGSHQGFVLLNRLIDRRVEGEAVDLDGLFKFLVYGLKKRSVVFLLGDFLYAHWTPQLLKMAARRHDLIAVNVLDPSELAGPGPGVYPLESSPGRAPVTAVGERTREKYRQRIRSRIDELANLFGKAGVDLLSLRTDSSGEQELQRLFQRRLRQIRHLS